MWKTLVSVHVGKSVAFVQTMHNLLVTSEDIVINCDVTSFHTKVPIEKRLIMQRQQFDEDNMMLYRYPEA
jgi:hypothetical protein